MLRFRCAALLQVVLFSCAMLIAWSHQAHERHGYCSEHGALIHTQEQPADHNADHEAVRVGALQGQATAKESHHAHGAHGCAVLAFLASGVSTPGPTVTDVPLDLGVDAAVLAGTGSAATISLLAQAPKASPPQA